MVSVVGEAGSHRVKMLTVECGTESGEADRRKAHMAIWIKCENTALLAPRLWHLNVVSH